MAARETGAYTMTRHSMFFQEQANLPQSYLILDLSSGPYLLFVTDTLTTRSIGIAC